MGMILGRVAINGRPVDDRVFDTAFRKLSDREGRLSEKLVDASACVGSHVRSESGSTGSCAVRRGNIVAVADATLFEREDTARSLGLSLSGLSDAELILAAFRRWGADCLDRLYGDFGFAIVDLDKREVFLARDHIGVRPLYWSFRNGEVLFSTLLQGLVGFDDLAWGLDETRTARFICNPHEFRHESFIAGAEIVGPGHWVRVSHAGVQRQRWWLPENREGSGSVSAVRTATDAQHRLRELTEQAIRSRLVGQGPVGAHLSAGLDSTVVFQLAALELAVNRGRFKGAYSWAPAISDCFPDMGAKDERHSIEQQCRKFDVPARFGACAWTAYEQLINEPMELQGTADLLDEFSTIEQLRADGVQVMLSGWGGDEVFSSHGIGHFSWLLRRGRLPTVLKLARRAAGGWRHPKRLAEYFLRAGLVPMLPDALYRRFTPVVDIYGTGAFPSDRTHSLSQQLGPSSDVRLVPDARAFMRALLLNGHIGERMATWAAWSERAGFEYRYPLTDRRLLEFLLALPPDLLYERGRGRSLPRGAFKDILPERISKRDIANEKRRQNARKAWLEHLAADVAKGRFAQDCPWLDMSALRAAMSCAASDDIRTCSQNAAPILAALRVYAMFQRHNQ